MTERLLPPRKRRKTRLACNPCRSRKTGCDGRRPACSSCTLKGWQDQCIYQQTVLDVHRQRRDLEKCEGTSHAISTASPNEVLARSLPSNNETLEAQQGNSSDSECGNEPVYGPSSHYSFLRQIKLAADPQSLTQPIAAESTNEDEEVPTLLGFSASRTRSMDTSGEVFLPSEQSFVQGILTAYWDFVHPVFPILHRPTFERQYSNLWQSNEFLNSQKQHSKDNVPKSIVASVLALGSQRSESLSTEQQGRLADRFYRHSCKLVSIDTLDRSSLQVVQLFLLRGLYLHYTTHADRCWNTVGVAIRAAQSLGLHVEKSRARGINQVNREMRRRVWYCCLTLDRLTSATFGRPVLVSRPSATTIPKPIDDENLLDTGEGVQPLNRPSRLAFFVHSIELIDILNEILTKLYLEDEQQLEQTLSSTECLGEVLRLSSRLDDFQMTLPDHLVEGSDYDKYGEDLGTCFQMQANIMKSRILWIRLLLLRPTLLAEVKKHAFSNRTLDKISLRDKFRHSTSALCVETAHMVLQEMDEKLGSPRQNSAWHVLLFTFAATSTLIAATLSPDLEVDFAVDPAKTSWNRALHIFEFHKGHFMLGSENIEALKRFRSSVEAVSRQAKEPNRGITSERGDEQSFDPVSGLDETFTFQSFDEWLDSNMFNDVWFNTQGMEELGFDRWALGS